jgi:phage portal protein BeeE
VERGRRAAFSPVLRKPNHFQNRIQFITLWLTYKLMRGNAYALKVRDGRGMVTGPVPARPAPRDAAGRAERRRLLRAGGDDLSRLPAGMVLPASEVIHDRINALAPAGRRVADLRLRAQRDARAAHPGEQRGVLREHELGPAAC